MIILRVLELGTGENPSIVLWLGVGSAKMEKRTNNDVWNKKKEEVKQLLERKLPSNEPCPEAETRSIVSPTPVRLHSSLVTEWEDAVQDDPAIDSAASPWLEECWHLDSIGVSNPAAHGAMFSALRYTADPFLDATMDPSKNTSMIGFNNTAGGTFDGTAMNPFGNTGWTTLDTTAMYDFGNVNVATFDSRVSGTIDAAQMDPIVWNAIDTFVIHETQHSSNISDMDANLIAITITLT
ncbi:hypothetical protein ACN47E_007635 [Coniothyrium glycines]